MEGDRLEELYYKVDGVQNSRTYGKTKKLQYIVKWKDEMEEWKDWEVVLLGCNDLVRAFHEAHLCKPGPPIDWNFDKVKQVTRERFSRRERKQKKFFDEQDDDDN